MKNVYLFLLAALVGIEIALGALVAPVIFYSAKFIGDGFLTHFQSGIIMSQIFLKYNYVLLFISVLTFVYESINLRCNEYLYIKISAFALSFINVALALSFVYYFTPFILETQALGEAMMKENVQFDAMHSASEIVMKIMIITQTLLFFLRSFKR